MNILKMAVISFLLCNVLPALSQSMSAQEIIEEAAEAMGGLDRIMNVDSLVMTGFSQTLGLGGSASPHPKSPKKWTSQNDITRSFNLNSMQALQTHRQGFLYPFALAFGHAWNPSSQIQQGVSVLNHPLTALRAALASDTELGAISIEDDNIVIEFTLGGGETLWLGINQFNKLPAWSRWIGPSPTLGELTYTSWFTGYSPFGEVRLPSGINTEIDWRESVVTEFHVDGYELDAVLPAFEIEAGMSFDGGDILDVEVTQVAEQVWDLRLVTENPTVETNGAGIVEFEDHLLMFEAYGSEANTIALIEAANNLVPGKQVTEVVVSHHHFDHSGGLRTAVSLGLTIISKRENEALFREMVSRPAPNFPDALALNPQPLKFIPVDEHLVLEDANQRVDVYEVVGHMHMTDAVFAYVPDEQVLMQGDMFVIEWDWHWWGDNYIDSIEHFDLNPVIDIPVHGVVSSFDEVINNIDSQVTAAREFCTRNESIGIYMAGCQVKYTRD
ncbi:MAG: MBL fold metallo-hydrolase [Gammaproteobacteria bacterium]|nr:MBL fold metallo-hydrolase [Gammaproteobacteria bacterium]